jgi:stress-induced-phosphoprotein 1
MNEAEAAKDKGNLAFKNKQFKDSVEHYSDAIKLDPSNHVYYSNRSAAYHKLENYDRMIRDARKCIELSPLFVKGYFRLITGLKHVKQYAEAIRLLDHVKSIKMEKEQEKEMEQLHFQIDKDLQEQYHQEELNAQQYNQMAKITEYQGQYRVELEKKKLYYSLQSQKMLGSKYDTIVKQLNMILKPLKNVPANLSDDVCCLLHM